MQSSTCIQTVRCDVFMQATCKEMSPYDVGKFVLNMTSVKARSAVLPSQYVDAFTAQLERRAPPPSPLLASLPNEELGPYLTSGDVASLRAWQAPKHKLSMWNLYASFACFKCDPLCCHVKDGVNKPGKPHSQACIDSRIERAIKLYVIDTICDTHI